MRISAAVLATVLAVSPVAGLGQNSMSWLLPSPVSAILVVGQWFADGTRNDRVYYIKVQGRGKTESEARLEAFKRATEEAVGSLVASESVVVDDQLRRREIISYSSAFVDRSLQTNMVWNGTHFVGDWEVWIRRSTIADRLLIKAESTKDFDGSRIQIQVDTLNYAEAQGERVLGTVLADYPARAYKITDPKFSTRRQGQQAVVIVDFELDLAPGYLYALWETLKATSQSANPGWCHPCRDPYLVHMVGRHNRWLFNRWEYTFTFANRGSVDMILNHMMASEPAVLATVRDGGGHPIHSTCHRWPELDGRVRHQYPSWQFVQAYDSGNRVSIDGRQTLRARLELQGVPNLDRARSLDLSVVRGSSCPR